VTITALTDSNPLRPSARPWSEPSSPLEQHQLHLHRDPHEAGSYDNTASVTVKDNEDNTASDTKTLTVSVTDVLPTVAMDKTVMSATLAEPGDLHLYSDDPQHFTGGGHDYGVNGQQSVVGGVSGLVNTIIRPVAQSVAVTSESYRSGTYPTR